MPGFGFGKPIIVGYAAFSKQCGLYVSMPPSQPMLMTLRQRA